MLVDRMLPSGGWNYGNTVAFGAELRPQVEPTGLALAALAGEKITDPRLARSIAYLNKSLTARTTTVSLCYGLLGLAGQGVHPAEADSWLEGAFRDTMNRGGSPYRLALATLAALGGDCPWFPVLKKVSSLPGGQK
jgi:cell wall-associated NlpC family hydrolase